MIWEYRWRGLDLLRVPPRPEGYVPGFQVPPPGRRSSAFADAEPTLMGSTGAPIR
jgi:hypothetical protein